jgi:hypothetical protein
MAIKKILMPIDRSGYREKILAYGISLGNAWGAELTAIHVIDPGGGGGAYLVVELKKRKWREKNKLSERVC